MVSPRGSRLSQRNTLGSLPYGVAIDRGAGYSMIPKSGYRFSEKIMLQQ